jgi:hypothetical protein
MYHDKHFDPKYINYSMFVLYDTAICIKSIPPQFNEVCKKSVALNIIKFRTTLYVNSVVPSELACAF